MVHWIGCINAIKMVISTETICAPEQGYMVFSSLKYTTVFFSPNSHLVSVVKKRSM